MDEIQNNSRYIAEYLMAAYQVVKIFITAFWGTLLLLLVVSSFFGKSVPFFVFLIAILVILLPTILMRLFAEQLARRARKLNPDIDNE